MSLTSTLITLIAALGLAAVSWFMQRRPRTSFDPPWPIPWTFLQLAAVVLAIVMLAHLISLGTGQPFKGRFGF